MEFDLPFATSNEKKNHLCYSRRVPTLVSSPCSERARLSRTRTRQKHKWSITKKTRKRSSTICARISTLCSRDTLRGRKSLSLLSKSLEKLSFASKKEPTTVCCAKEDPIRRQCLEDSERGDRIHVEDVLRTRRGASVRERPERREVRRKNAQAGTAQQNTERTERCAAPFAKRTSVSPGSSRGNISQRSVQRKYICAFSESWKRRYRKDEEVAVFFRFRRLLQFLQHSTPLLQTHPRTTATDTRQNFPA